MSWGHLLGGVLPHCQCCHWVEAFWSTQQFAGSVDLCSPAILCLMFIVSTVRPLFQTSWGLRALTYVQRLEQPKHSSDGRSFEKSDRVTSSNQHVWQIFLMMLFTKNIPNQIQTHMNWYPFYHQQRESNTCGVNTSCRQTVVTLCRRWEISGELGMVTQPGPKVQKKGSFNIRSVCMWLDIAMIMIYDLLI